MTLIAGLVCADGLVICSDTELTLASLKASRSKIFVTAPYLKDCTLAIAGAGDYDYCKAAIQFTEPVFKIEEVQEEPGLDNLQSAIADATSEIYTEHIWKNPNFQRDFNLMVAMWRRGEGLRLLKTLETVVIRIDRYDVLGSGGELAEYILKKMYSDDMTVAQAVALCIYMLAEIKERRPGVGGDTQITVISEDGRQLEVMPDQVGEYEQTVAHLDVLWKSVFDQCFNLAGLTAAIWCCRRHRCAFFEVLPSRPDGSKRSLEAGESGDVGRRNCAAL